MTLNKYMVTLKAIMNQSGLLYCGENALLYNEFIESLNEKGIKPTETIVTYEYDIYASFTIPVEQLSALLKEFTNDLKYWNVYQLNELK